MDSIASVTLGREKNSKRILDPTWKHKSIEVLKYSSIQVFKYSSIEEFKYSYWCIQVFNLKVHNVTKSK